MKVTIILNDFNVVERRQNLKQQHKIELKKTWVDNLGNLCTSPSQPLERSFKDWEVLVTKGFNHEEAKDWKIHCRDQFLFSKGIH